MGYLVGTCGYAYSQCRGVFYPERLKSEDFLAYYATKFPTVEVDSTFYRMPTSSFCASLRDKSGGSLLFSLKAPQTFTHQVGDWKGDAALFRSAVEPLAQSGQLSALLFQFPQRFHYTPDNRVYLANLLSQFPGFPAVVEFRDVAWMRPRVYDGLNQRDVGLCVSDLPPLDGLPQLVPVATGGVGYVRFHGRNASTWYAGSGSERYDYLYSDTELSAMLPPIQEIGGKVKKVHLFFNNHPQGKATINAETMMRLLGPA